MLLASGVKSTRFAFAACQAAVHGDMVTQKYIEDHRKVWKVNIHVLDAEWTSPGRWFRCGLGLTFRRRWHEWGPVTDLMVLMPPGAAPIDDIGYIHTYIRTYIHMDILCCGTGGRWVGWRCSGPWYAFTDLSQDTQRSQESSYICFLDEMAHAFLWTFFVSVSEVVYVLAHLNLQRHYVLQLMEDVCANLMAFTAVKIDGSVVTRSPETCMCCMQLIQWFAPCTSPWPLLETSPCRGER